MKPLRSHYVSFCPSPYPNEECSCCGWRGDRLMAKSVDPESSWPEFYMCIACSVALADAWLDADATGGKP